MTTKTKRTLRISILIAGICLVLAILVAFWWPIYALVFCRIHSYTRTNLKYYEQLLETDDVMPRLDALGETLDLDFKLTKHTTILYTSHAYLLTASYDAAAYDVQKKNVLQNYEFEEETFTNHFGVSFDVRFTVDGYDFGVLSLDRYDSDMPHKFYCIGTSESEHKIAWLYFTDWDLDEIPSWEDLLRKDCGWG
ncbi:MAG: hypothetical protein IJT41_08875 [Clostridia bacterium]|nr:hypothetical protein [Clostridia bacterium]